MSRGSSQIEPPPGVNFLQQLQHHQHKLNATTVRNYGLLLGDEEFPDDDYMAELSHPAHDYTVVVYSAILVFGVLANLYILVRCVRADKLLSNHNRSKLHLLHVVAANLFICLFAIPIEIGWRMTIEWRAGDFGCKFLQFLRVLGLYALANNLTAVALDKVVEVNQLMRGGHGGNRPTKYFFGAAWLLSFICSFPQFLVFQTGYSSYSSTVIQCVGIESFAVLGHEHMYNIFMLGFMFIVPALTMLISYAYIHNTVKSARDLPEDLEQCGLTNSSVETSFEPQVRTRLFSTAQQSRSSRSVSFSNYVVSQTVSTSDVRSGAGGDFALHIHLRSHDGTSYVMLDDSFERDLRIFSTVSVTFIVTCAPHVAFTLWYLIDAQSHSQIHPIIQELPLLLVLANTLLIPAVYALKLCVTY